MSKVYIFQTRNSKQIYKHLKEVSLRIDKDTVLIKPNIVIPAKTSSAVVTDVYLVEAIVKYLKAIGVKRIIIGEAPGLNVDVELAFKVSGFTRLAQKEKLELLNLEKADTIEKPWKFGKIKIPKIVFESYYINVPKLKTHMQTLVTLGLKNQKGLLRSEYKKGFHITWGLDEPIAELAKIVKPDLTIVDGIVGIEGDGPLLQGKRIKSHVCIIGEDIVSVDATCCRVMGIDPFSVLHINIASKIGVGEMEPEISGVQIEKVKRNFKLPNMEYFKMFKLFNIRTKQACSMCSDSLREAMRMTLSSPVLFIKYMPKWIYLILFKGVQFTAGAKPLVKEGKGKVICLGKCSKRFAEEYGYCLASGCPPSPEEILKSL
jgi:uncharacterized protein (DUF362 family)